MFYLRLTTNSGLNLASAVVPEENAAEILRTRLHDAVDSMVNALEANPAAMARARAD